MKCAARVRMCLGVESTLWMRACAILCVSWSVHCRAMELEVRTTRVENEIDDISKALSLNKISVQVTSGDILFGLFLSHVPT